MGLLVNVYKSADGTDCSNRGISSRFDTLCVVNVPGPFEPTEKYPAVELEVGAHNSIHLTPVESINAGEWTMAGGNYAGTCDSRFAEAVESMCGYRHSMISIHDRVE